MTNSKHVIRVFLVLILVTIGFAVVRALYLYFVLDPQGYGKYGPYRHDDVATQMDHEVRHHGAAACGECHDEIFAAWSAGAHSTVNCENCHAPYTVHIKDGDRYAAMPIVKNFQLCLRCHRQIEGRPADFPQKNVEQHLAEHKQQPSEAVCFKCHNPHQPAPVVPQETAEAGPRATGGK